MQSPGDETRVISLTMKFFLLSREGQISCSMMVRFGEGDIGECRNSKQIVVIGGSLSDRKGLNVPSILLPISPMTPKDREDLAFGLEIGVDYMALSFVQSPKDVLEAQ